MEKLLAQLQFSFRSNITSWQTTNKQQAKYGKWPEKLDKKIIEIANKRGIKALWKHQSDAIHFVLDGKNIVIATSTASGKTLCYNIPFFQALLENKKNCALYLFPTKALAHDQLHQLESWLKQLGTFFSNTYDGDTQTNKRAEIRKKSNIIVSNPDMLHIGILPHHTSWERFFRNLRFVVLDEIHIYRGVFGSHVANVLRRLQRICNFYGSNPQYICCSATIANALDFSKKLTGKELKLIDYDESPKGERHFLFYNPPIIDKQLGLRRGVIQEARRLAKFFIETKRQNIIFTKSRQNTELLLKYLREDCKNKLRMNFSHMSSYRGGYRPEQRRDIEKRLREGEIKTVVSTNALELGIDIGKLDGCILAGYPGTIASTLQRSGRTGRREDISVIILIAGNTPLDQYIVKHPEYFFSSSPEKALINPDNLLILMKHLLCSAFELPFCEMDFFGYVETEEKRKFFINVLEYLVEEKKLRKIQNRYYWMSDYYPAQKVNLRTTGADTIIIREMEGNDIIGTIDKGTAPFHIHPGAIYIHLGETYFLEHINWNEGEAFAHKTSSDYYTSACSEMKIIPLEKEEEKVTEQVSIAYGEIEIHHKVTGFRKLRFYTHEMLGYGITEVPKQEFITYGYWFEIEERVIEKLREDGWWNYHPSGYRGKNWQKQRNKARERDHYICQLCKAPEKENRQHDVHHIKPFSSFGYIASKNTNYIQANTLDNLVTLCRKCHFYIENLQHFHGALTGVSYVIGYVASLLLMCDMNDIGYFSEVQAKTTKKPTLTIYEKSSAGIGFSKTLFRSHDKLLSMAKEIIDTCKCEQGCPSCVGPIEEEGRNYKAYTLAIIEALL